MKQVLWLAGMALALTGCVYIHDDGGMGVHATSPAADAADWRPVDAANTLVVDTDKGRIFVELYPQVAPKAVERVKLLTRRGSYDGLQFWRVVPKFVVQVDVGNAEGGKTELPNLPPEFRFRLPPGETLHAPAARPQGLEEGFLGVLPYVAIEENSTATPKPADGARSAWVSYCTGVMGMGRDNGNDTANAEIFFMTGAYPGLDKAFTPVGRVVAGQALFDGMPQGEPAEHPDAIRTVRMLADVPDAPRVEVMDTRGPGFARLVAGVRKTRGADFSVCDVTVPSRVTG